MNCTVYTVSYNSTIHASYPLAFTTYKYNELQVSFVTQKKIVRLVTKHLFFSHSEFLIIAQEHLVILGVVWKTLVVQSIVAWSPLLLIQWLKNFSCYLNFFGQWSKNLVANLGNGKNLVKNFGHQIKQMLLG